MLHSDILKFLSVVLLLVFLNLFLFRNEWRAQYQFIKKATVIIALLSLLLLVMFAIFGNIVFFTAAKLLGVGLISILIFLPVVFDQLLRLLSFSRNIESFAEALILYRNILNGTANEFIFGIKSSQKSSSFNLYTFLRRIGLLSITLVGRIPQINDEILISTCIRQFSIHQMESLCEMKFWKSMAIASLTLALIFCERGLLCLI